MDRLILFPAVLAVAVAAAFSPPAHADEGWRSKDVDTIPLIFPVGMMRMMRGGVATILLTISVDTNNYNLRTAAGSPAFPCNVICTINSGIVVRSTSTGNAAFVTGTGWISGTSLTLINNGSIKGKGGVGGQGGDGSSSPASGQNGLPGGPAVNLSYALTIDNTSGYVLGGSGGGGGGADNYSGGSAAAGAAGGGGGVPTGVGGPASAFAPGQGQTAGQTATDTTGGQSGDRGFDSFYLIYGGYGGENYFNSQGYGAVGFDGESISGRFGGTGGAAGNAVTKNGNTLTWTGGNNGTQVKGAQV